MNSGKLHDSFSSASSYCNESDDAPLGRPYRDSPEEDEEDGDESLSEPHFPEQRTRAPRRMEQQWTKLLLGGSLMMAIVWWMASSPAESLADDKVQSQISLDASSKPPSVTYPFKPKGVMYKEGQMDRSGSVITSMLIAHSYAFYREYAYGGTCGDDNKHQEDVIQLLEAMGLSHILPYKCPSKEEEEDALIINFSGTRFETDFETRFDAMTPEWMEYLQRVRRQDVLQKPVDNVFRVAVHTRRGDVALCGDNAWKRYLPNSHFLPLIERALGMRKYPNQPYEVTVYSESIQPSTKHKQYEDFSDFEKRNYTLNLDGDLPSIWKDFVNADVLITSKSTFAIPPAILRFGRPHVIYTPMKAGTPMPHWEVVEDELLWETEKNMMRMQKERCPEQGRETDLDLYLADRTKYGGPKVASSP